MKKSISVIIPNYNGRHLLELYLPSVLAALSAAAMPYELIVVDDCSTDDSVIFLRKNYPELILIVNPKNGGFSFTCNQGIKVAGMELTLLLNSDVQLTKDYFASQWKYFEKEDTFGVMGRIMSKDGQKIEDAARILFYNMCRIKANRYYYSAQSGQQLYTAYLSGANALINTEKLKKLGGFDEIYTPFTSEDSDLCTRAWLIGWKCYYEHGSVCYHQVSGSIRTQVNSSLIKKIYFRNRFIFHRIYLTGFRAFCWPVYILLFEVLPKLLSGKLWILKSYIQYLKAFPEIHRSIKKLDKLKEEYRSGLKIKDVMKLINDDLRNKPIVYL